MGIGERVTIDMHVLDMVSRSNYFGREPVSIIEVEERVKKKKKKKRGSS